MTETIRVDVCVIGGGAAGLSVAAAAAQLGAPTALIEKGRMGGECLNAGCVPSKALIAAARAAEAVRRAPRFGVDAAAPTVDFARVHAHVHDVIAAIAPTDSAARFTGLGVRVIAAEARFTAPDRVVAGGTTVIARRFVLATGSRPAVPPVPGLETVPYETNETIFARTQAPAHLLVLGGGPIGVELAQAHRRLGAAVTIVEAGRLLPRSDPELAAILGDLLRREGVAIHAGVAAARIERAADGVAVVLADGRTIAGSHLLVATGRRPVVDGLGLEAAGVAHTPQGITVNAHLRTTNRRIYAVGDCAGGPQFTHVAAHHAGVVVRNVLFRLPARVDLRALPRVTYTAPELAEVGLGEDEARARHGRIEVLRFPFSESDRARADRAPDGLVKAIVARHGRVVGAAILGEHAGELLHPWTLAVARRLRASDLARVIAPYPTLSEASQRAAASYYLPRLLNWRVRRVVGWLRRLG